MRKWRCYRIDGRPLNHYAVHIRYQQNCHELYRDDDAAGRSDMNVLTAIGILLLLFAARFLFPMGVIWLIGRLTGRFTQLS